MKAQEYMSRLYHADLIPRIRAVVESDPYLSDKRIAETLRADGIPVAEVTVQKLRTKYDIPNKWQRMRAHKRAASDLIARQPIEV